MNTLVCYAVMCPVLMFLSVLAGHIHEESNVYMVNRVEHRIQESTGNVSSDDSDCQFTFDDIHGNFASPGFPSHFPNSFLECDWTIKYVSGKVKLEFKTLDIPMVVHNGRCVVAYIMYGGFNYEGERVITGKTCGQDPPSVFFSRTPWAWVTLVITGQGRSLINSGHKGLLIEYHADVREYTENQLIVAIVCGLIVPTCCVVPVIWYYFRKKQMEALRIEALKELENVRRKAMLDTTLRSLALSAPLPKWIKDTPMRISEFIQGEEEGGLGLELFHMSEPRDSQRWFSSLSGYFSSPQSKSPQPQVSAGLESPLAAAAPFPSGDEINEWSVEITEANRSVNSLDSEFIMEQPHLLASSTPHPVPTAGLGSKLVAQRAIQGSRKKSQQPRPSLESISEADENLPQYPNIDGKSKGGDQTKGCLYPENPITETADLIEIEQETIFSTPLKEISNFVPAAYNLMADKDKRKTVTFHFAVANKTEEFAREPMFKTLLPITNDNTPPVTELDREFCMLESGEKGNSNKTLDKAQESLYFECQDSKGSRTSPDLMGYSLLNSDPSMQTATSDTPNLYSNSETSPLTLSGDFHSTDHACSKSSEHSPMEHCLVNEFYQDGSIKETDGTPIHFKSRVLHEASPKTFSGSSFSACSSSSVEMKDSQLSSTPPVHGIVVRHPSISTSSSISVSSRLRNGYEMGTNDSQDINDTFRTPTSDNREFLTGQYLRSGCRADILDAQTPDSDLGDLGENILDDQDFPKCVHTDMKRDLHEYSDKDQQCFPQVKIDSREETVIGSTSVRSSSLTPEPQCKIANTSIRDCSSGQWCSSIDNKMTSLSQDERVNLHRDMSVDPNLSSHGEISSASDMCSDVSLSHPMNSSMMSNAFAILSMPSRSPSPIATVQAPLELDHLLPHGGARQKDPESKYSTLNQPRGKGDGMPLDKIHSHGVGESIELATTNRPQNTKDKRTTVIDHDLPEVWNGEGILLSIKNLSKFAEASCFRSSLLHGSRCRRRHLSAPTLNTGASQTAKTKELNRKSDPPRSSWLMCADLTDKPDFRPVASNIRRVGPRHCLRGTRRMRASCPSAWAPFANDAQKQLHQTMSLPRKTGGVHFSGNSPDYINDLWPDSRRELELSDLDVGAWGAVNVTSKRGYYFPGTYAPSMRDSGLDHSQVTSISRVYNSSSSMSPKWGGNSIVI